MTSEAWAIVAATALGPIAAVAITLRRESARALTSRRLHVFRTLMSTRKAIISNEHVGALNLVEVDFYACPGVQKEWKSYLEHLNNRNQAKESPEMWSDTRDNRLARLLYEIGKVLGYDMPAIDLYKGGYAPETWDIRDAQNTGAVAFLNDLGKGTRSLPVTVLQTPEPLTLKPGIFSNVKPL